jgi:hypothetical protein
MPWASGGREGGWEVQFTWASAGEVGEEAGEVLHLSLAQDVRKPLPKSWGTLVS